MDVYTGKDELALRKLLDNTTDYSERRKIRSAIRGLKNVKTYNNNNVTEYKPNTTTTIHPTIDSQSMQSKVETTVTKGHHLGNSDHGGGRIDDDSIVHKSRYRKRMQAEEERQRALDEEKEEQPKIKLEEIDDEDVLTKMLKDTTVYEERKKIRAAIRELRRKKEENAKATESHQESSVSSRTRNHVTSQQTTEISQTQPKTTTTTMIINESEKSDTQTKSEKTLETERVKEEDTKEIKTNTIEDIKDEEVLKQMLKDTEDYDERKRIRTVLRELRKKNREKCTQEETKEAAKNANHTSGTSVQIENKELEKRNGQVAMEINFNQTDKPDTAPTRTVPKMIVKTHSKTKLEKFDMPTTVAKQPVSTSSNRTLNNEVETKSDHQPVTVEKGQKITLNVSQGATKQQDPSADYKSKPVTSKVVPKTEPTPNKTAIKIQLQQEDKNRLQESPADDTDEMEESWENINDLGSLEICLMTATDTVERVKIRAKIRELKKKELEARKAVEKTWKEDKVEVRPDPNTKITTTVMKLSKPTMEGERVEKEIVNEQKTDTGVKKTTRTMITLATTPKNGSSAQVSAKDEVPVFPKKTYLSRSLVAKEITDDYSSCYTSEEEEEMVVESDGQKTYTTKTRVVTKKFESTDNKTGSDIHDKLAKVKPTNSIESSSTSGHTRRRAPSNRDAEVSDSSDSEDEVNSVTRRYVKGHAQKKAFNTAKERFEAKPAETNLPKNGTTNKKNTITPSNKIEVKLDKKDDTTANKKVELTLNKKGEVLLDLSNVSKVEEKQEKQTERYGQPRQGQGEATKQQSQGEPSKEVNTKTANMAPTPVEEIEDEAELEKMLDAATDFDERRKIRTQLRDVRRKRREERDRKMAERERAREQDKKDRMAAADKRRLEKLSQGLAAKQEGTLCSTNTTTTRSDKNDNTPAKTITTTDKNANTTTVKTTTDSTPSKSVTTTTEKKRDGGTTMEKTTTVTEKKDSGSRMTMVEEKTVISSTDGGGTMSSFSQKTTSSSGTTSTGAGGRRMSKFEEELEAKRKAREAKRESDMKSFKEEAAKRQQAAFERKKMDSMSTRNKRSAIMDKFGGQAKSGPSFGGGRVGGGRMMVQNANTIKAQLLEWAKSRTAGYANIDVTNFSRSWADGMAFCALIHHYYPDSFDYNILNPKNRKYNFDLAFGTAEKEADIMPLLETEDMLLMGNKPDWKCVFTYVQSLYRHLSKKD